MPLQSFLISTSEGEFFFLDIRADFWVAPLALFGTRVVQSVDAWT